MAFSDNQEAVLRFCLRGWRYSAGQAKLIVECVQAVEGQSEALDRIREHALFGTSDLSSEEKVTLFIIMSEKACEQIPPALKVAKKYIETHGEVRNEVAAIQACHFMLSSKPAPAVGGEKKEEETAKAGSKTNTSSPSIQSGNSAFDVVRPFGQFGRSSVEEKKENASAPFAA